MHSDEKGGTKACPHMNTQSVNRGPAECHEKYTVPSNWDKKEGQAGDVQYFKAYIWNGEALEEKFAIDFIAENLGRPHQMRFGAHALYADVDADGDGPAVAVTK